MTTPHHHHPSHAIPFRYDEALLSSCASSALARSLVVVGLEDGEQNNAELSLQQHQVQKQKNLDSNSNNNGANSSNACRSLFELHATHYHRPPLSKEEVEVWSGLSSSIDGTSLVTVAYERKRLKIISPRSEAFLQSVLFVHRHNTDDANTHKVALNRFSDVPSSSHEELPLMSQGNNNNDDGSSNNGEGNDASMSSFELEAKKIIDTLIPSSFYNPLRSSSSSAHQHHPLFVPLDNDDKIVKFGEKIQRSRELHRRNSNNNHQNSQNFLQSVRDSWWWVGGGHANHANYPNRRDNAVNTNDDTPPLSRHHHNKKKTHNNNNNDDALDLGDISKSTGLEESNNDSDDNDIDDWATHLNWATEDNPDGVPVVHAVMDQGLCGSCWAVSALGTLEASIARNMAYISYEEAYSSFKDATLDTTPSSSSSLDADAQKFAVLAAQQIERRSIDTADLSVQELVDCDRRYDQGCAGGNPLLAFYFLHRFGVTSSKNYPYTGEMNSCQYRKVDEPIATVETWGILTPDHENNMEKVLRYIGPVAVGLIGADTAFLSYQSGIFMSSKGGRCDVGQADHAMLITGYGQEVLSDGTIQKYWIARNSWGTGWGEDGYVKMARLGGKKGHRGVCGIARSPSVALGGMFTKDVELDKGDLIGSARGNSNVKEGYSSSSGGDNHSDDSTIARASSQIKSFIHQIRTKLGFLQKGIVMSTNNGIENRVDAVAIPSALTLGMLVLCLLLAQFYRGRRRRRGGCCHNGHNEQGEEESVATNWSTRGVYNGVREDMVGHWSESKGSIISSSHGERMHLLEGSSGSLYT